MFMIAYLYSHNFNKLIKDTNLQMFSSSLDLENIIMVWLWCFGLVFTFFFFGFEHFEGSSFSSSL